MNIIDVCKALFPGEIESGNITFRKPEDDILIGTWKVSGHPQPTEAELLALIPQYEERINRGQLVETAHGILHQLFERTAIERGYRDSMECVSYFNSSLTEKAQDAQTFITWRDAVWNVFTTVLTDFENGQIPKPTRQEFIGRLPTISW